MARLSLLLIPLLLLAKVPEPSETITALTSYADLTATLHQLEGNPYFTLSEMGRTTEDRSLWLLKIAPPDQAINWKIFFYAQQHGNEPAGKEALLVLARHIAAYPDYLPKGVALYLMPMVNPDGGEKDQRRNASDADINRDHMTLDQPETRALHRAFREIRPNLSIDCHEFGRDSDDYLSKGWIEWPEIMMDHANTPLLNDDLVRIGSELVERMGRNMLQKGIHFHRYFVGGVPPEGEQRFSAPDLDGGLNASAMYGGLSFIIEGGVYRQNNTDDHDLPQRVSNYSKLLAEVLHDKTVRKQALKHAKQHPEPELSPWLPTNYFWAKTEETVLTIPAIDQKTSELIHIPAPNFMTELVIKKSVASPKSYAIPAAYATQFRRLLYYHELPFTTLENAVTVDVEPCFIDSVEMEFDDIYHRYGGRTISHFGPLESVNLVPGDLLIHIDNANGNRVMALLEPSQMYGLYQYPAYGEMIAENKQAPVWRILDR